MKRGHVQAGVEVVGHRYVDRLHLGVVEHGA